MAKIENITNDLHVVRRISAERDYVYVRDIEIDNGFRNTFIRLVRPGEIKSNFVESYDAEDCTVDVDQDGNIVGVTFTVFGHD
jgi:uncharacterized protein YuzE